MLGLEASACKAAFVPVATSPLALIQETPGSPARGVGPPGGQAGHAPFLPPCPGRRSRTRTNPTPAVPEPAIPTASVLGAGRT